MIETDAVQNNVQRPFKRSQLDERNNVVATSENSDDLQILLSLGIDPAKASSVLDVFNRMLEVTIKKTLVEAANSVPPASQSPGTELKHQDKVKAADLRLAQLMGKLPENSGILIDTKTFAQLLSVSSRHLSRLQDLKSVPEPVHLGRSIRWRLTEVLELIEDDCPSHRNWEISKQDPTKRKRK